jgi:hypothetical protein
MSYDAHQREAVRVMCVQCHRTWYVTHYQGGPYVCIECRRLRANRGAGGTPLPSVEGGSLPRTISRGE